LPFELLLLRGLPVYVCVSIIYMSALETIQS
jgi:hypothetical protein